MAMTLRLSEGLELQLTEHCAATGAAKSRVMELALTMYLGALGDGSGVHVSAEATVSEGPISAPAPERVLSPAIHDALDGYAEPVKAQTVDAGAFSGKRSFQPDPKGGKK